MNRNKMGILLIIIGIVVLTIGIVMVIQKPEKEKLIVEQVSQKVTEQVSQKVTEQVSESEESITKVSNVAQKQQVEVTPVVKHEDNKVDERTENEKKGLEFEKWVISRFPKKYYRIIDWKGDKIVNGRYAESSRYPDLELELSLASSKIKEKFSVECKWRKAFYEGKINWASQTKIGIYNDYANERGQAVFLVLGVGGEPNAPERVYIIPLNNAQQSNLKEIDIEQYRRKDPAKDFYYFAKNKTLN